jgi:UDP-N-acetylglucosamine 2-epimerase (non-hydrolysing)
MEHHRTELPPGSVGVVLGTRPEIIKLAYVIKGLGDAARVIHTGQHYDFGLSASFFESFDIPTPPVFLGVGGLHRAGQIGAAISALGEVFGDDRPRAVVVQGDTNTTLAGAVAANAHEIPLVHVEAGLRSRDRRMPEEHNRVVTDHLADVLCAPTDVARKNLEREGIDPTRISVTGNTVVEAVQHLMPTVEDRLDLLESHGLETGEYVLSTFHRPENVDDPERFAVILEQLSSLPLPVVLPLHPRSRQKAAAFGMESQLAALEVIDPVGYREFLGLSAESAFLVSDSGGVQEEVSIYKRPVILVRRSTERPEVIGTFARLVEPGHIAEVADDWLGDVGEIHHQLATVPSPYGDGRASERIVDTVVGLVDV